MIFASLDIMAVGFFMNGELCCVKGVGWAWGDEIHKDHWKCFISHRP